MSATAEIVPYGGWTRNLRLASGDLEAIVTLEVGPRVIRFGRVGGPNLFGEIAADLGGRGEGTWKLRGGHRLWVAPEDPARTYTVDNGELAHELRGDGVRITAPPDPAFELRKSLELAFVGGGTGPGLALEVVHRVRNEGREAQELALWALTIMAPGGTAVIPLPRRARHPEALAGTTRADFAPNQALSLWPYFSFDDPRLALGSHYIGLRQDARLSSTKLGLLHRAGWVAYVAGGHLFVKRFGCEEGARYPDGGCNFEMYTDPGILELETLSPLVSLEPGAEVAHVERWEAHALSPVASSALETLQTMQTMERGSSQKWQDLLDTHLVPIVSGAAFSAFSR